MKQNLKTKIIVKSYYMSSYFVKKQNRFIKLLGLPIRIIYKIIIEFIMSIEIPDRTMIGKNLIVYHGVGVVVNSNSILGDNVIIRQNTTIGSKRDGGPCPKIGNNVDIGCNVVIIGDISIGDNVIIGAGSVVTKSFPSDVVIAGNPAKIIKVLK